jgi:hypothetical protein
MTASAEVAVRNLIYDWDREPGTWDLGLGTWNQKSESKLGMPV